MKLRDYQVRINDAVEAFLKTDGQRAQIWSPTGSGKTVSFTHTIKVMMKRSNKPLRILIAHPRLALSHDQMKRAHAEFGLNVAMSSFHSGGVVLREGVRDLGTTNSSALSKAITEETKRGKHHITFASYYSLDKLAQFSFDLVILDEAHNVAKQSKWLDAVNALNAKRILSYTATPVTSAFDGDIGQDVEACFGPVIVTVTPSELISKGYIVAPMLHDLEVSLSDASDSSTYDVVQLIADAFNYQKSAEELKFMRNHKMLVACKSIEQLEFITSRESLNRLWQIFGRKVNVYACTADSATRNGRSVGQRFEMLEDFASYDGDAIILHFNTIAEGIDISGLTAALLLRELPRSLFGQTIGRCGRPFSGDLNENFEPKPLAERAKQRCIISVPTFNSVPVFGTAEKFMQDLLACGYDINNEVRKVDDLRLGRGGLDIDATDDGATFDNAIDDITLNVKLADLSSFLNLEKAA